MKFLFIISRWKKFWGVVEFKVKKFGSLSAVSRSVVIGKTQALREVDKILSFKSFKQVALTKREEQLKCNEDIKEKFAKEANDKQVLANPKESARTYLKVYIY